MTFTRKQVIAYRIAVQGLHRDSGRAGDPGDLSVLDLGVQEAMGHAASVILAARLADATAARDVEVGPGRDLALAWTFRGAPHIHRRSDLDRVVRALWPLSEADAMTRLNENGRSVERQGIAALEQFELAVAAMRASVARPTDKGAASTAATRRLPEAMRRECRSCGTPHLSDSAMRAAAPVAGLELEPGTSPPVLLRRRGARLPRRADPAAVAACAAVYLTHLGPASDGDVAGFLGARRADVRGVLNDDAADEFESVEVDGRSALLPAGRADDVAGAPAPDVVRLLGPFDPYLQARDRDLIVPDPARQKALWPALGRPGAILADGEIVGTWRAKAGATLTVTVTAFTRLPARVWDAVSAEAETVAVVRGAADVRVVRGDS